MRAKQNKTKGKGKPEKPITTADFKERLQSMPRQTSEVDRVKRPCVRMPSDSGYYPPERTRGAQAPIDDHASALVRIVELTATLEAIRALLSDPNWTPDTLDAIAALVNDRAQSGGGQ